jgi:thioesterase domain-containing protein
LALGAAPASAGARPDVAGEGVPLQLVEPGHAPPYVLVGHSFGGAYDELFALAAEQIQAAGTFGAHPVRVLVATEHPPKNEAREVLWKSLLTSLAEEARDGDAIIFRGAGHVLQSERPEEVARAILAVLPESAQ